MERPSVEALRLELAEPLARAGVGGSRAGGLESLIPFKAALDDPHKLLARDLFGAPAAVVLVSAPVAPDLVARGMARAREIKSRLGTELGRVILVPLGEGRLESGASYTILEHCRPIPVGFSGGWMRRRLRRPLLAWLREATRATVSEIAEGDSAEHFDRPLAHLVSLEDLDPAVREAARAGRRELREGTFPARSVMAHNDLWIGNVLLRQRSVGIRSLAQRIVLIDWPGACLSGHGIYDLVRLARSLGLSRGALRRELKAHCALLGCSSGQAVHHLLAALGQLGLQLEHFPPARFNELCHECFGSLAGLGLARHPA